MAKILVVDDTQFMRMRCSRLLTNKGHEVAEAQNGREAVEAYQKVRPDAVLLDITMPEMDGIAALRQIRDLDPNARVVMLTALGQQGVVLECIKAGARDFIVKPFETERFLAALQRVLS